MDPKDFNPADSDGVSTWRDEMTASAASTIANHKTTGIGSTGAHKAADALSIIRDLKAIFTLTASNCTICGKPLRDAVSVSRGIGPHCSGKVYDIDHTITDNMVASALGYLHASGLEPKVKSACRKLKSKPRDLCNLLIWWSAANLDNKDTVLDCANVVGELGFELASERMRERNTDLHISVDANGDYTLRCKSNWDVRRNLGHVKDAKKVARKGRFTYGWKFPAKVKSLVWAICGLGFGGEWASVPNKDGKPGGNILKVPATTRYDVNKAFAATYPPKARVAKPVAPVAPGVVVNGIVTLDGEVVSVKTPTRNFAFIKEVKNLGSGNYRWNPEAYRWEVRAKFHSTVLALVATHFPNA